MNLLQDIIKESASSGKNPEAIKEQEGEDDEIPQLNQNFEEVAKVDWYYKPTKKE